MEKLHKRRYERVLEAEPMDNSLWEERKQPSRQKVSGGKTNRHDLRVLREVRAPVCCSCRLGANAPLEREGQRYSVNH